MPHGGPRTTGGAGRVVSTTFYCGVLVSIDDKHRPEAGDGKNPPGPYNVTRQVQHLSTVIADWGWLSREAHVLSSMYALNGGVPVSFHQPSMILGVGSQDEILKGLQNRWNTLFMGEPPMTTELAESQVWKRISQVEKGKGGGLPAGGGRRDTRACTAETSKAEASRREENPGERAARVWSVLGCVEPERRNTAGMGEKLPDELLAKFAGLNFGNVMPWGELELSQTAQLAASAGLTHTLGGMKGLPLRAQSAREKGPFWGNTFVNVSQSPMETGKVIEIATLVWMTVEGKVKSLTGKDLTAWQNAKTRIHLFTSKEVEDVMKAAGAVERKTAQKMAKPDGWDLKVMTVKTLSEDLEKMTCMKLAGLLFEVAADAKGSLEDAFLSGKACQTMHTNVQGLEVNAKAPEYFEARMRRREKGREWRGDQWTVKVSTSQGSLPVGPGVGEPTAWTPNEKVLCHLNRRISDSMARNPECEKCNLDWLELDSKALLWDKDVMHNIDCMREARRVKAEEKMQNARLDTAGAEENEEEREGGPAPTSLGDRDDETGRGGGEEGRGLAKEQQGDGAPPPRGEGGGEGRGEREANSAEETGGGVEASEKFEKIVSAGLCPRGV